ncbi:MAG: DNA-directed RNA polymerase subunit RpoH/Rpb5 C-terminal domain-containing protein [archaeon]
MIKNKTNSESKEIKIKEVKTKDKLKKPKKEGSTRRARRIKPEILHAYIPKHEVLNSEELEEFKKKYSVSKLPEIFVSDPAIRHLEIKIGSVIRITRINNIIGNTLYYRRVVRDLKFSSDSEQGEGDDSFDFGTGDSSSSKGAEDNFNFD